MISENTAFPYHSLAMNCQGHLLAVMEPQSDFDLTKLSLSKQVPITEFAVGDTYSNKLSVTKFQFLESYLNVQIKGVNGKLFLSDSHCVCQIEVG